ncbi:biopolymer transporter ExbD [Roseovarius sp. LXJ103]|uniref:biopolymer transporter ExbD n=1 Tax=Roseovarius carneus TaxID=2853164 RepID=UPI000D60B312|nr:biopolymer transporter ExbD [Roseovarius carneus]MBZ8119759.1 biopolymer transporter ExbD [Roseovarius carneus]PWE34637.1 biopolymer transporter ExbD [Pelagicola sp. LXJ1103]
MTSLIDVIFLLLLFFMLSSTFSKFSEITFSAANGGAVITTEVKPLFMQLGPDALRLNGETMTMDMLLPTLSALPEVDGPLALLISLKGNVTSQRLTDLLVVLHALPNIAPTVLEAS